MFRIKVFLLSALVFFAFGAAHADNWRFARPLEAGARGPDVFTLQKILNERAETRVAEHGAGSPGNETNYFGPATARAIAVFQQRNAIVGEMGRVGPATLAVLNKRNTTTPSSPPQLRRGAESARRGGVEKEGDSKNISPNARNLDQFLGIVKQVGGAQGYEPERLETLTKEVSSYALGTTTDFFAQFVKDARKSVVPVSTEPSFLGSISASLKKVAKIFIPEADAQGPGFDGVVVYVFPCTCSGNWLIGMLPFSVPPISLITHYPGSQAYAFFTAPFTLFMLGNYIPQGAPCLFYVGLACTQLPSQAQTTPILGSS